MFKRFRQLHISLAAKCQILFGASVVLIIGAALAVPWRRMEQLMDQLNERAAQAVADEALADHVAASLAGRPDSAGRPEAASRPSIVALYPATLPVSESSWPQDATTSAPPRLIGVNPPRPNLLTRFERRSLRQFAIDPDLHFTSQQYQREGIERYRYALRLNAEDSCVRCHCPPDVAMPAGAAKGAAPPSTAAAKNALPTTMPLTGDERLLGIMSVDMLSQVDANQIFLNRLFILSAGMLAGTLAIAVFYLITTRLILKPVRVLQETAEKVSEGDLNIRSDISTGDEFQQLSETFNTMLANLKKGDDQLRSINKSLDLKLGQLAESNVALYESNRLKSEFLANVSHELRTPLNSILGFAELLKDVVAGGAEARPARYVQNILTSGKNLLELINDLLDLAKIEAGKMDVRSEPLVLGDLFEGLANVLRPLTEPKGLSIEINVAADVPILQTDPAKLQQVLYNFLSNSIKFSPQGEKVELTARREGESSVYIAVADQGPGIDSEKQSMIFEKFRQIDGSVTRKHGGSGLGLSISKELIGLLGGKIGVESSVGSGATFWVVLPIQVEAGTKDVKSRMVLT